MDYSIPNVGQLLYFSFRFLSGRMTGGAVHPAHQKSESVIHSGEKVLPLLQSTEILCTM